MKTDALKRRSKLAGPQPIGKDIVINDRDRKLFIAIDRHGKLPSGYLHRFAGGERSRFKDRLTKLFHGVEKDGQTISYIGADPAQIRTVRALSHQKVYHLTEHGKRELDKLGLGRKFNIDRNDHFLHQLYGACLSASFELQMKFLHLDDIVGREKCPQATKEMRYPVEMQTSAGLYIPDNLFGIEYEDGGKRYFMVEIDRGNEPKRSDKKRPSIDKKLRANVEILQHQIFRSQYGIGNMSFLYATTGVSDAYGILRVIREIVPEQWQKKFFVQANPIFDTDDWRVPTDLLEVKKWITTEGEVDISKHI